MTEGSPASSSYNAAVALEFFRSAGKPKTFAKGRKIFAENQRGFPFLLMPNRMYLLLDGEVAVFAKNTPIGTVRPGQIFGEMASIDQGPRSATGIRNRPQPLESGEVDAGCLPLTSVVSSILGGIRTRDLRLERPAATPQAPRGRLSL